MRSGTIVVYDLRSIAARPWRSLGIVAGVCLCVALYVALNTLAEGYGRLVRQPLEELSADVAIQRPAPPKAAGSGRITLPPTGGPLEAGEIALIESLPGIERLSPSILLWDRSGKGFMVICGADVAGAEAVIGAAEVRNWVVQGRPLEGDGDLLLEKHYARFHALEPGSLVNIGGREQPITGIVELGQGGLLGSVNAFVTLAKARELAGMAQGSANLLFAQLEKGASVDAMRKELESRLPGAVLTASDSIGEMLRGFGVVSGHFTGALSLAALLFAALASHRLLSGAVQERRAEFAVMKAVGWRRRESVAAMTVEAALLGLASGAAGVALGNLAAAGLARLMLAPAQFNWNSVPAGSGLPDAVASSEMIRQLPLEFSWWTAAAAITVSVAMAASAGWFASRSISRQSVMEGLRQP